MVEKKVFYLAEKMAILKVVQSDQIRAALRAVSKAFSKAARRDGYGVVSMVGRSVDEMAV